MVEAWDIEQEVNIAIYNACMDYDESKMDSPIAYIEIRVKQAVSKYLRQIARQGWLQQYEGSGLDIEKYEEFLDSNGYINSSSEEQFFDKWLYEDFVKELTDKQRQVADLLLERYTQEEIAEFMGVSQQAVSKHVKLIRNKLKDFSTDRDDESHKPHA